MSTERESLWKFLYRHGRLVDAAALVAVVAVLVVLSWFAYDLSKATP